MKSQPPSVRVRAWIVAVLASLAVVLVASVGSAQTEDPAALKAAGDQAMEKLQHEDALDAYSKAYAINQDPALLYNMGRALQALNRFPEALEKLEAFEKSAPAELKARVPRLAGLMSEIRQRISTVTIKSNVDGARVLVRGTDQGKSPLPGPLRLASGTARIEVDAEGYFPFQKSVELPGGGAIAIEATLASKATSGVLSVKASAPGAEVLVDGVRIGIAPVETALPKGTHKILVRHPDHADFDTSAEVPAGGRKDVTAQLEAPSIFSRWYFWAGVGAVVVTGAVITVALLTERSPDSGTIPPGQLPAPGGALVRF